MGTAACYHCTYAVYYHMFCVVGTAASYTVCCVLMHVLYHVHCCFIYCKPHTVTCFVLTALLLLILNFCHMHCCFVPWALLLCVLYVVDMLYAVYWHVLAMASYMYHIWCAVGTAACALRTATSYVACSSLPHVCALGFATLHIVYCVLLFVCAVLCRCMLDCHMLCAMGSAASCVSCDVLVPQMYCYTVPASMASSC